MSVTALTSDPRHYATPSPTLRTKQTSKRKPFVITGVYDLLLQGVNAHFLITADQLNRLYYKPGMITTIKARLKELVDHKYLDYLQLLTRNGSGAYVYFLAVKGRKYLTEAGFDMKGSYRPAEEKERSYQTRLQ